MLYLLYHRSGFIKKFPLTKKVIYLGRSSGNDMNINESFISQKHAKIDVYKKHIHIEDLGSTNGIFIGTEKIKKARIEINKSFRIGHSVFFLKEGRSKEFAISSEVSPGSSGDIRIDLSDGDKTQDAINLPPVPRQSALHHLQEAPDEGCLVL